MKKDIGIEGRANDNRRGGTLPFLIIRMIRAGDLKNTLALLADILTKYRAYMTEAGELKAECGPPIKAVGNLTGKQVKFKDPKSKDEETGLYHWVKDEHVHEVQYIHSEKIHTRKVNKDAVIAMGLMEKAPTPTPEEQAAAMANQG